MVELQKTLDDIKKELIDKNLRVVSIRSGVSYDVLRRFKRGEKNISLQSLLKINNYLANKESFSNG